MNDGSDVLMVGGGQISRKKWTASGGATQREKLEKNQKSGGQISNFFRLRN